MTVKDPVGQVFDQNKTDLSVVDITTEKNQEITDETEMVAIPFRTRPETAECLKRMAALSNKDVSDFINDHILQYFIESVMEPDFIWGLIDCALEKAEIALNKDYWRRYENWPKSE